MTWQDIIEARDAPTHNVEGVLGTSEAMLLHIYIYTLHIIYICFAYFKYYIMDGHPLKNRARRTFRRSPFSADWSSRLAASMCHGLAVEIPLKHGKHMGKYGNNMENSNISMGKYGNNMETSNISMGKYGNNMENSDLSMGKCWNIPRKSRNIWENPWKIKGI